MMIVCDNGDDDYDYDNFDEDVDGDGFRKTIIYDMKMVMKFDD